MAFSNQLATDGYTPDHLHVEAEVSFEKLEGGWTVTSSALSVMGNVPGCPDPEFERLAEEAKDGCPISRALAGNVRLVSVEGRDGPISKATLTAISNTRRGSGDNRGEEATAILWTLWGKQADNAAQYLASRWGTGLCVSRMRPWAGRRTGAWVGGQHHKSSIGPLP